MKRILTSLMVLGALSQGAHAETYTIDSAHSNVLFTIRHLVSEVEGRFNDFAGTIDYDPAKPEASKVNLTVQTKSVNTDNEKRDTHLKSKDFFEVDKYPTATFVSKSVKKVDDKNLEVTGDFSLHGVTQSMTVSVKIFGPATTPMGKRMGAKTEFKLDRHAFKVDNWTDKGGVLGDEVEMKITVEARAN